MEKLKKLIASLVLMGSFASCDVIIEGRYWDCYLEYDWWYGEYVEYCGWYYYDNGDQMIEMDVASDVADKEQQQINLVKNFYADKFSLSNDNAEKIARNVLDFDKLKDRTAEDIADFAQKLYGVNPTSAISAIANASLGNNKELEILIEDASKNFDTSKENMREIIKTLHGKQLNASGIEL